MEQENFSIKQVLPDAFDREVLTKDAICIKISKKSTGVLIDVIRECGLNAEKVFLLDDTECHSELWKKGKIENKIKYTQYDISFLKKVKPLDKESNLVMLNFVEVN
jgi:hypothetical protein